MRSFYIKVLGAVVVRDRMIVRITTTCAV